MKFKITSTIFFLGVRQDVGTLSVNTHLNNYFDSTMLLHLLVLSQNLPILEEQKNSVLETNNTFWKYP